MIYRATEADLPEITTFLKERVHQSMFPLSNLGNYGLDGEHSNAPSMWFVKKNGSVTDVLTITRRGMVMPQCPNTLITEPIMGRTLTGIIGPAGQCQVLRSAVGLANVPCTLDRVEPHFLLDLSKLRMPETEGALISFAEAPRDLMIDWQIQYDTEALGFTISDAKARSEEVYDHCVQQNSHMILMRNGQCVAKAGLNAQLPDIVQVGGVFTPPEKRGRGFARRVMALLLKKAYERGVGSTTLFAANKMAVSAYLSIGFERIGDWNLTLFNGEQTANG